MDLYHATDKWFEEFDETKAKPLKDFGKGYYLTSNVKQALAWAKRKGDYSHSSTAYIYRYTFSLEEAFDLRIRELICYNDEWVDFLCESRVKGKETDYDLIFDKMADSNGSDISSCLTRYSQGIMTASEVLEKLQEKKTGWDQYCFKTSKARAYLKNRRALTLNKESTGWQIYET